ncbi:MAG: ABC transporter permease subunit [Elusimicrobia bacterium]|nr:ABC transporter permease subunit [Elusimicrobiota bacterium]
MSAFAALVGKEFRETARSRWLAGFVGAFAALGGGISLVGTWGAVIGGAAGFGRTTAALVNLILLVVPLMSLTAGVLALAGERESGTLETLLALPLRPAQVFWGKFVGVGAALASALALAFGALALVLAWRGGLRGAVVYVEGFAATALLALACLALGLFVGVRARRVAPAVGAALLLWLGLVFAGDLGLLGTAMAARLSPAALLGAAWLNPLSLYRLLAVDATAAGLDVLGPAGRCAQDALGPWLRPAAFAGLCGWLAAALAAAARAWGADPLGTER